MHSRQFVLYSRQGCHLCEVFEEEFKQFMQAHSIEWNCETRLIDESAELIARYGNDVPVLTLNDAIICQHFFDPNKIQELLL